jgi:signal peptidase I
VTSPAPAASADVISVNMTGDQAGALTRANMLARMCPYPDATVYSVPGTHSMQPTLDEGCYVVLAKKPWTSVDVNDIGSFIRPAKGFTPAASVLHRIVDKFESNGKRSFVLRGDNNVHHDQGTFTERDYQGVVYAVVRFADVKTQRATSRAVLEAKQRRTP